MAVPSAREVAREARRTSGGAAGDPALADVHPGEVQLLRLLLLRPECREAGLELDPDTFEHGLNRRLFEVWVQDEDIASRTEELDDEFQKHYASLSDGGLHEAHEAMTGRQLQAIVRKTAHEIRERRQRDRLSAESVAVAHEVAEARRGGADMLEFARKAIERGPLPPGTASPDAELAANLVELSRLTREAASADTPSTDSGEVASGPANGDNGSTERTGETTEHEEARVGAPDDGAGAPEAAEVTG